MGGKNERQDNPFDTKALTEKRTFLKKVQSKNKLSFIQIK